MQVYAVADPKRQDADESSYAHHMAHQLHMCTSSAVLPCGYGPRVSRVTMGHDLYAHLRIHIYHHPLLSRAASKHASGSAAPAPPRTAGIDLHGAALSMHGDLLRILYASNACHPPWRRKPASRMSSPAMQFVPPGHARSRPHTPSVGSLLASSLQAFVLPPLPSPRGAACAPTARPRADRAHRPPRPPPPPAAPTTPPLLPHPSFPTACPPRDACLAPALARPRRAR